MLSLGQPAPIFQLKNQNNQLISNEQYKGKYVITYFYPKAQTPGCTRQACALRDAFTELADLHAVVLGISPDTPEALKKFEANENLNFQLLSDPDHQVAEAYGAWAEKTMYGKTYFGINRSTYLIDKEGKIAHIIKKANPDTHLDDVLKILKEKAK